MFFTVKQCSHIRGRTSISRQSAYLPKLPSTPQGSVSAGLPVTLVNECGYGVGGVARLQTDLHSCLLRLSVYGSVVKSMASCCSGCVPLPLGLLLPNQTFHSSKRCFLTKVRGHSYSHLLACRTVCLTVYLPISSPGSSLLAHLSLPV